MRHRLWRRERSGSGDIAAVQGAFGSGFAGGGPPRRAPIDGSAMKLATALGRREACDVIAAFDVLETPWLKLSRMGEARGSIRRGGQDRDLRPVRAGMMTVSEHDLVSSGSETLNDGSTGSDRD